MSGELEAAGGLATAGLVAAAIEGGEPGEAGAGECLNCGAQLKGGRFCANCGQSAHANRSLWALLEELLWNVFNLDTKAWRTLPRLMFRPGTLTRTYIDGKRAHYLTPLATFLLCYFLMFLVFSVVPKQNAINLSDSASAEHASDARENLNDAKNGLNDAQQELADAQREAGPNPNGATRLGISAAQRAVRLAQAEVARRQARLDLAQKLEEERRHSPVQVHVTRDDTAATRAPDTVAAHPTAVPAPPANAGASAPPPVPPAPNADLNDDGPVTLDDVLKKMARDNITVKGKPVLNQRMRDNLSNPPLFYNNLKEAASRWGFLLVPLSLPFIGFLFLFKKNITLYDHTVFALNSLSFASLLFALMLACWQVSWLQWVPLVATCVVLPVHTFFHVGGAYKLKWWSAFWRTWFLLWFAIFVLTFFLLAVLFIGLAG